MTITLSELCSIVENIRDFDKNAKGYLRSQIGSALSRVFYDSADEKPEAYALLNDASNFNYADEQLIFLCEDYAEEAGLQVELELELDL